MCIRDRKSSSTGGAVIGVMVALTAIMVGGYLVSNGKSIGSFGGFELPVLRVPGLG